MAWMHVQLSSAQVRMPVSVEVLLSQKAVSSLSQGEKLPVLYLLHDRTGDHSQWLKKAALETYQEEVPAAIVLPSGNNSYYVNLKYGKSYQNYIRDELPAICERLFPISSKKEEKYLAGVGMGGYGALHIALTPDCPFGTVGAFQADINMEKHYRTEPEKMEEIFGSFSEYEESSYNLVHAAEQIFGETLPEICIMCAQDDDLTEENRKLYRILKTRTERVEIHEEQTAAGWRYYGACLDRFMKEKISKASEETVWQL